MIPPCAFFINRGFRATGINQVISESNVAKATFYSNFSSQEKLCVTYLRARHTIFRESVNHHDSPSARLLGIFDFIRERMNGCDFRGCAFLNIASEIPNLDSDIRVAIVRHKDALKAYLSRLLAKHEDAGSSLSRNLPMPVMFFILCSPLADDFFWQTTRQTCLSRTTNIYG